MQEAMTRPRREGYNAVIDTAKGILRMVRANKERLPDCNYSGLEATAEFLLDVLDVHEKCRIVIEYDPAEERTAVYRTEFEGKPITFNEYNAKQKNASHYSQHLYGKAADIWIAGVSVDTLAAYVETLLPNRGGIGRYYNDNFVHVDVRAAKSRWKG